MEQRKEYIKLAHANVNQNTTNGEKTEWKIRANITDEPLGELPKNLNPEQVFGILNMARKYELEAFNKGIDFGKSQYKDVYDESVKELHLKLKYSADENERLAEALETITNNKQ